MLVSGSKDSTLKVWDTVSKELIGDLPGHADEVFRFAGQAEGLPGLSKADKLSTLNVHGVETCPTRLSSPCNVCLLPAVWTGVLTACQLPAVAKTEY